MVLKKMERFKIRLKIKKWYSSFIRDSWGNLTSCYWNEMAKDEIQKLNKELNHKPNHDKMDSLKKHVIPEYKSKDEVMEIIREMDKDLQVLIGVSSKVMKKANALHWGAISPEQFKNDIRVLNQEFKNKKRDIKKGN